MNQEDLISVIMATYNCENSIVESIESIINQTYTNWEFIICDDCSTDRTYQILQDYKGKYPNKFVILKNKQNSKLSYSLNHCLKYAKGKYIARMDGDDKSDFERLRKQIEFLKSHRQYQLVGTSMRIYDGEQYLGVRKSKEIPNKFDLLYGPCFAHATIMTYKSVYDKLGGYLVSKRTERGQDYDLWFRFFAMGYKGYNMPEPLYIVTEDEACYKRKKFKYRIHTTMTAIHGYRINEFPKRYYIFAFKHIVAGMIPQKILKYMHRGK